jgi:hypothetical protein
MPDDVTIVVIPAEVSRIRDVPDDEVVDALRLLPQALSREALWVLVGILAARIERTARRSRPRSEQIQ